MTTILVTGGAGFIGSNIAEELVKQGYNVKILDDFSTGNEGNISGIKKRIEMIKGDIRDLELLKKTTKNVDFIFHEAALTSVQRSIEDPTLTNDVNIRGTLNILISARDSGVNKVIYASSSSVYGDTPTLPKKEIMEANPISPYALSKFAGEEYCRIFSKIYGIKTISLRYFNVFGPRQNPNSEYAAVIPKFITALLNNKPPVIFGDGEQSRDFTFIADVIQANIFAMKAKNISGEAFNIACGKRLTINDLAKKINRILDKNIKPEHIEPRKGDVRHSLADISKVKRLLGYEPRYDLKKGLGLTTEWFRRKYKLNR